MKQTISCGVCGKKFIPPTKRSKFCSKKSCKQKASQLRWEAWRERKRKEGTFREIENERQRKYRSNTNYSKNWDLKSKYGITLDDWLTMLDRANQRCELCGKKEDLCVDHDHITKVVRGVLCRGCNRSIGQLGDTLEHLKKAVAYLERTPNVG